MILNANIKSGQAILFLGPALVLTGILVSSPNVTMAAEDEVDRDSLNYQPRIYRNPAERREAGLLTEITDWLTFSGLLEIEKEKTRQHFRENVTVTEEAPTTSTLQLTFKSEFQDWLEAEIVFETEYSRHLHDGSSNYHSSAHSLVDEAEVSVDVGDAGVKFGRLNIPFGEYNSYFVTGPMLEFGETRRDAVMLNYTFTEAVEVTLFVFDSKVDELNGHDKVDWGASFEYKSKGESVRIGASYLSDLSESDEQFLEDFNNNYLRQVPAWSAYILYGFDEYELTLETVNALDEFAELDPVSNKPSSTNLEFASFAVPEFLFAFRFARSNELQDSPEWEYGLSATWLSRNRFSLSADYLYGDFRRNFVVDDNDIELSHHHQISIRLSVEL